MAAPRPRRPVTSAPGTRSRHAARERRRRVDRRHRRRDRDGPPARARALPGRQPDVERALSALDAGDPDQAPQPARSRSARRSGRRRPPGARNSADEPAASSSTTAGISSNWSLESTARIPASRGAAAHLVVDPRAAEHDRQAGPPREQHRRGLEAVDPRHPRVDARRRRARARRAARAPPRRRRPPRRPPRRARVGDDRADQEAHVRVVVHDQGAHRGRAMRSGAVCPTHSNKIAPPCPHTTF